MKYIISAIDSPFGEEVVSKTESSPEKAILQWCKLSKKYPTCVSIQPENNEDGMALLKWAEMNFDKVEAYLSEYRCPYKTDWIKEQISAKIKVGKTSMMWEYDQLFPFCMG